MTGIPYTQNPQLNTHTTITTMNPWPEWPWSYDETWKEVYFAPNLWLWWEGDLFWGFKRQLGRRHKAIKTMKPIETYRKEVYLVPNYLWLWPEGDTIFGNWEKGFENWVLRGVQGTLFWIWGRVLRIR